MKPQAMRAFLLDFFACQGARTEVMENQILHVTAPRRLANRMGGSPLRFAFNLGALKADPASELAMVGNPVFDRILDLARESGCVGERFLSPPARPARVPPPPRNLGVKLASRGEQEAERVYTPFYFFVFRVEFSLEEVPDASEIIPLDGITMESPSLTPDLGDYWDALEVRPVAGREILPAFPVPEEALRAAMEALEHRLRKRIGRLRRTAQEALASETKNINDYYQQLIDETRNASRRWVLPPGGKEERIRLLQLDWKRRAEDAEENWKPRAEVTLSAVGAVQRPRVRYSIDPPRSRAGRRQEDSANDSGFLYWDEVDKVFAVPAG